jgi:GTPase Era involved in 16S rRNA processing
VNNYFIIGKVNEGKSFLFNLFSKAHKTISNPKANTTIDIIRKNILSETCEYSIYDTPGFYKFSDFTDLLNKILVLRLNNISFIYLTSSFTNEDLKICKKVHSKNYNLLLFSFKQIDEKEYISNLFDKTFTNNSDNFSKVTPLSQISSTIKTF